MVNTGEILLDNLTISRLPIMKKCFKKNDIQLQNYLYSLILWDKIICVEEYDFGSSSSYKQRINNYIFAKKGVAHSVRLKRRNLLEMSENRFYKNTDDINDFLQISNVKMDAFVYRKEAYKIVENMEILNIDRQIAEDTIRYILLGYNLGLNICLSSERTNFICLNHYDDYIFNRLNIIDIVENNVKEFYEEINSKIGKKIICFQSPLLFDYICRESKTFDQALHLAKKLKREKHLVEYRRTMDEMERCLNEGNFIKFNEYLSIIPDIVNSIKTVGIKTQAFEIGLNPIPSISTNFEIAFGKRAYNKLHLRFLKDLAKFGMTERVYRI